MDKYYYGYIALFFTIISNGPYLWTVIRRQTQPHIFSWIIWSIVSAILFAAQTASHSGPGAWATGLSCLFALTIALFALAHKADATITRFDWITFVGSLSAIPLWYFTQNPLSAAIMATLIDAAAYLPTFRKSYHRPHEEMAFLYIGDTLKHIASLFAIAHYSATTLVAPLTILLMNGALVSMLLMRRRQLAK